MRNLVGVVTQIPSGMSESVRGDLAGWSVDSAGSGAGNHRFVRRTGLHRRSRELAHNTVESDECAGKTA